MAVPRNHAGVASRSSLRLNQGRRWAFSMSSPALEPGGRGEVDHLAQGEHRDRDGHQGDSVEEVGEFMVNSRMPVTESMPTTAIPSPRARDSRPLTAESVTTEDVATNANRASAKNSAAPNWVENLRPGRREEHDHHGCHQLRR